MSGRQRYERRPRHIYALLFESGCAYIGQTVDPRRRERQHRRAWTAPFTYRELGTMVGTYAEAEDHEYAWRYAARRAGWRVIATTLAGSVISIKDPARRMTAWRYRLAADCRWPVASERRRRGAGWLLRWLGWQSAAIATVLYALRTIRV